MTATRRITDRGLVPRERIIAVAVTSQWAGTVLLRHSNFTELVVMSRGRRSTAIMGGDLICR